MKPLIGITGYYINSTEMGKEGVRGLPGQDMGMFSYDYIRSLQRAGATAVLLPIDDKYGIDNYLDRLDGILLAGGADINPFYYGDDPHPYLGAVEEERDDLEIKLAKRALERDIPVFGICRGLQVLNVAAGGSLYQDLEQELGPEHVHSRKQFRKWQGSHSIDIVEDSKLYQATGANSLIVNSYHHQAVKNLGADFKVTAWSSDHIVEAIESNVHQYATAVQWHPEMMSEKDNIQQFLFNHFINKVGIKLETV